MINLHHSKKQFTFWDLCYSIPNTDTICCSLYTFLLTVTLGQKFKLSKIQIFALFLIPRCRKKYYVQVFLLTKLFNWYCLMRNKLLRNEFIFSITSCGKEKPYCDWLRDHHSCFHTVQNQTFMHGLVFISRWLTL